MKRLGLTRKKLQITFLISLSVIACAIISPFSSPRFEIPQTTLDVPTGNYERIIRFPDGEILLLEHREDLIFFREKDEITPAKNEAPIRFYNLNDDQFLEVPISMIDERCPLGTNAGLPSATPDGRLAFRVLCGGYWADRPLGQQTASFVMTYDWERDTFEQIVDEPLPGGAFSVTWHPNMERGVQVLGSMFATIYWVTPRGMEPLTLTLQEGNRSWNLAENLAILLGDEKRLDVGIAESPAWSPNGQRIAFVASFDAIGKDGFARVQANQNLYLLTPETFQVTTILKRITNTRGDRSLTWAPNSQWIVIAGRIKNVNGLWLVSVDGQILELVASADDNSFQGEGWLDNQTIIAIKCVNSDIPCSQTDVIMYDVRSIVQ